MSAGIPTYNDQLARDAQAAAMQLTVTREGQAYRSIPRKRVVCVGDSLLGNQDTLLPALLGSPWTGQCAYIGGDTSTKISDRLCGPTLAYPLRGTDSLSAGTVYVRAIDTVPARLIDGAFSATWQVMRGAIATPRRVQVRNKGVRLGEMKRRDFLAESVPGTDSEQINLYEPVSAGGVPLMQDCSNETQEMNAASLSFSLLTHARSSEQAHTGTYSSKVTDASSTHGWRRISPVVQADDGSLYWYRLWIYIPSGNTSLVSAVWTVAGTSPKIFWQNAASITTKGSWQYFECLCSVQVNLTLANGAADSSESVYIDGFQITKEYTLSTHRLADTTPVWIEPYSGPDGSVAAAIPSGLSSYRGYYVVNTNTNTVELSLTSGGAAVGTGSAATFVLHGDYQLAWTAIDDDEADYEISLETVSEWADSVHLICMGANNPTQLTTVEEDIRKVIATLRSANSRFLIWPPWVTNTEYLGTVSYDNVVRLTAWLNSNYPDSVVDVLSYLQGKNDASANDLIDVFNGIVPRSLRSDAVHLNSTGQGHLADTLYAEMTERGWL